MSESGAERTGVLRVASREFSRIASDRIYLVLLLFLPALSFALLYAIFANGVPRDLPVVLCDLDRSPLSRQVARMVDETPGARIYCRVDSPAEAENEILSGRAQAALVVPRDFERDLRRGTPADVVLFTNAQALPLAGAVTTGARAAVATFSAGVKATRLAATRGLPAKGALAAALPVRGDLSILFNPYLNYVTYLVSGLLPAMLQLFVLLAAVMALASELRYGTAAEWLAAAGGSVPAALLGKLLPYVLHFSLLSIGSVALVLRLAAVPVKGSVLLVAAGTVLFVLAYIALALPFVALTGNLRMATSVAAFVGAPAFAFAGITFPWFGMPPLGKAWSALLPLTHYLRLLCEQTLRGASPAVSAGPLLALAAFVLVTPWIGAWRWRTLMTDPARWGKE